MFGQTVEEIGVVNFTPCLVKDYVSFITKIHKSSYASVHMVGFKVHNPLTSHLLGLLHFLLRRQLKNVVNSEL